MQKEEFKTLYKHAQSVTLHDVHLGRLLEALVLHVASAHGLDTRDLLAPPPPAASEDTPTTLLPKSGKETK